MTIKTLNRTFTRPSPHRVMLVGWFGVTLWRRGAISLQVRGHFLQIVIGDWWRAT